MEELLDMSVIQRLEALNEGDERAVLIGRLFDRAIIGAYFSRPEDLGLIIGKGVDHVLRTGITPQSPLAIVWLAVVAGLQGHVELGIAYAEVAVRLAQRVAEPYVRGRVDMLAWCMCLGWKHSFEESERSLHETFFVCQSAGDLQYASYALLCEYIAALMGGRSCGAILQRCERWLDYCVKFVPLEAGQARIRVDAMKRLMAVERETIDAEAIVAEYADQQNFTDVCESLNELVRVETLLGDYRAAYEHAARAEPHIEAGAAGTLLFNFLFYVHYAVACAQLSRTTDDPESALNYLTKVDVILEKKLRPFAELAPANFRSYYSLATAERARSAGELDEAATMYLTCIGHAVEHGYVLLEGFANELLARLHHESGDEAALGHFREARALYLECGALAKALQLEAEVPELLETRPRGVGPKETETIFTLTTTGRTLSQLDLATVLKASQAIAGEIELDRVVARLIGISVENAGGERGVFVSADGDRLTIEAEGRTQGEEIHYRSAPLDSVGDVVPAAVIRYVARTREPVVLADAGRDGPFAADPYVADKGPKSMLALPIIRHDVLAGVLYLENTLVAGAFTAERLELLRVLSAQMAISLENAHLYTQLEEKVQERTRELSDTLENLRLMQRQMVESEKLAALGGLVAGVAHEINTPVGIAVTAASHLVDRTSGFSASYEGGNLRRSDLDKFVETVKDAGQLVLTNLRRANELVQSFKQVAVDQSSEAQRTFEVRHYLEDILQSLRPKLKRTSHRIEIECDQELVLNSYPGALAQVVTNLVMNSLTHAYDSGDIGTIRFEVKPHESGIRIDYSDDGKGIGPDLLPRIFDPFFTTRRAAGGSGLGLHIVYNLVTQRLGGSLSAQSEPGAGTRFTISIPNASREADDD